jgi:hypothetical protein
MFCSGGVGGFVFPFGAGVFGDEVLGLGVMSVPLVDDPVPIEPLGDPGPLTVR